MENPKAIQEELEMLDKMRAEAIELADLARMAHAVSNVFKDRIDIAVSVARWIASPPFINMRVNVRSFKDVLPILTHLASRGWHTDKNNPYVDYPEIDRRTFNFVKGTPPTIIDPASSKVVTEHKGDHRLRLMCFIAKEGATCRKVKVGVKEEPVYEFVCD